MELINGSYKALEEAFVEHFNKIKTEPLDKVLIITQSQRLNQRLKERLLSSEECLSCVFWQDILGLVYNINQASDNYIPLKQKTALDYFKLKDFLQKNNFNTSPGYIQALQATFLDLQNALIGPRDLLKIKEFDEALYTKDLKDLIFIYQNYLKLTKTEEEISYKDFFIAALDKIEKNSYLAQFKQIIFYGIYDLTSLQYDIVKATCQNYPTAIFYPYEPLPAYKYVQDFYLANIIGLSTEHKKAQLPKTELETFCSHFFEASAQQKETYSADIKIIDTSGTLDQVKSAAKEVLLLHKAGLAYKDMALCARSLEPYKDYITQVFEQNAIPINVNFEDSFAAKPLVNVCVNLLNIARNNFNKDSVLSLLSCPYLIDRQDSWGQTIKDIGVQTGFEQWMDLLDQARLSDYESALSLKSFLIKLEQKVSLLEEAASFATLVLRAKDIFNTFINLEKINDEEQKYLETLYKILDEIVSFDKVRPAKKGEFLDEFTYLVNLEKINIVVDLENSLTVADIMNLRGQSFKTVIVLGLNEGVFPLTISQDPVFKDSWCAVLQQLGYSLKVSAQRYYEEKLFFYFALSAASDKVVLIYERCDSEGKVKIPSVYLTWLEKSLDKVERFSLSRRPAEQLEQWHKIAPDLLNPQEAAIFTALKGNFSLVAQLLEKEEDLFASAFSLSLDGALGSRDLVCQAKGPLWHHITDKGMSPTSLQNIYLCPAKYLFENILKREDVSILQRDKLDPRDSGTLAHKILEEFYLYLSQRNLFEQVFAGGSLNILQGFIDKNLKEQDYKKYGLYPLLWISFCKKTEKALKEFIYTDLTNIQNKKQIPTYFEKYLSADLGAFKIQGKIDRIDLCHDNSAFSIMDYKSGSVKRDGAVSLIFGKGNFQGPIYFELAQNIPELKNCSPSEMAYAYIKENELKKITYEGYLTFKEKFFEIIDFLKGLIEEGLFIINPEGPACQYCSYVSICHKNHEPSKERAFFSKQVSKLREYRKYDAGRKRKKVK